MHHRNHRHSSANHNNPAHHKSDYPSSPALQSERKPSVISRIRERFREKPATAEEVKQLRLDAQREVYKTQKQKAKNARGSRFDRIGGSSGPSYRRSSPRYQQQDSGLFGGGGGGSFMDFGEGPSLSFLTGASSKQRGRQKQQSFGSGLTDFF